MVDQGFKVIDFHCHFPVATNWGGMGGGRGSTGRPESAITGGGAYKSSEQSQKAVRDYAVSLRAEWRLAHSFEAPRDRRTHRTGASRPLGSRDRQVRFGARGLRDRRRQRQARRDRKLVPR